MHVYTVICAFLFYFEMYRVCAIMNQVVRQMSAWVIMLGYDDI